MRKREWSHTENNKNKVVHIHIDRVGVLGKMYTTVSYKRQTKQLPLLVVKGEGPNLMK